LSVSFVLWIFHYPNYFIYFLGHFSSKSAKLFYFILQVFFWNILLIWLNKLPVNRP